MYDGVNPSNLPTDGALVCGWVDGAYGPKDPAGWTPAGWARFPHATHVRIAAFPETVGADVYDVEKGDLTPADVPGVLDRERAAGRNPTIYGSHDTLAQVRGLLGARPAPPWWDADPTGVPHLTAGSVATQWLWTNGYDQSVVADHWPGVDPDQSNPPRKDRTMQVTFGPDGKLYVAAASPAGHLLVFQAPALAGPWEVEDVTDKIAAETNQPPIYTVAP